MIQGFLNERGLDFEGVDNMIREARRMLEAKGYQVSSISTAQEGAGPRERTVINILISCEDGGGIKEDLQGWLRRSIVAVYPKTRGVVVFRVSG
ncbi:MAG: hypothetical protein OEZ32_13690 [Nitrospinota bacterium]|nr:hypothetical protein [Nitrospinota bacterium]